MIDICHCITQLSDYELSKKKRFTPEIGSQQPKFSHAGFGEKRIHGFQQTWMICFIAYSHDFLLAQGQIQPVELPAGIRVCVCVTIPPDHTVKAKHLNFIHDSK